MERDFLRPMRIGEIYDNAFFLLRKNFKTLVNLHVVLFLPMLALVALIVGALVLIIKLNPFLWEEIQTTGSVAFVGGIAFLIIGGIGLAFVMSILFMLNNYGVYRIFGEATEGRKVTWKESLKGSLQGVLFIFIAGLVLGVAVNIVYQPLNIMFQITMAFYPWIVWIQMIVIYTIQIVFQVFTFLVFPIIVMEKKDPFTGIWRSCKLVWRNFGRTLSVYLLFLVIGLFSYLIAISLFFIPMFLIFSQVSPDMNPDWTMLLNPWFIGSAGISLVVLLSLGFIFFMLWSGIQVMMLNDLRIRSEGYDLLVTETVEISTN